MRAEFLREEQTMSATVIQTPFRPDPDVLRALRNQIQAIERHTPVKNLAPTKSLATGQYNAHQDEENSFVPSPFHSQIISLGAVEIDAALPWNGFPVQGLHEVFGDAAAHGFSAAMLARLAKTKGGSAPILWCQQGRDLCGQGLMAYGIDPSQVIIVHGKNDTDILWAMEEGLRSACLSAVIGQLYRVPPIAGRRLQLAAEENGVTGILLRATPGKTVTQAPTAAALTRWRVLSAPSLTPAYGVGLGKPNWHLELQRCRLSALQGSNQGKKQETAGRPQSWLVEWCNETGDLSVAPILRDGSVEPQRLKAAG